MQLLLHVVDGKQQRRKGPGRPVLPVLMATCKARSIGGLGATNNRRPELSRAAVEDLWLSLRHRNGGSLQNFF